MSIWLDHNQNRFSQDGNPVWNDNLGQIITKGTGTGVPTWTTNIGGGSSILSAYKFAINDTVTVMFHFNHDLSPGLPIYFHTHWMTDGTSTNTVKWQFSYNIAAGNNTANFSTTPTVVSTPLLATNGTAYRHMISEISTGITDAANIVVDGMAMVQIQRVTNGGTDNADGVYLLMSDVHYQASYLGTKNKAPNFYV